MIKCPDCGYENCNGCPTYTGVCNHCGKDIDEYLRKKSLKESEKKDKD